MKKLFLLTLFFVTGYIAKAQDSLLNYQPKILLVTAPELAEENDVALIPFIMDEPDGREELIQSDRLHPTAEGHKVITENVWEVLKPRL